MNIGVLALQGGFAEHLQALKKIGVTGFEIRKKADLGECELDGLILPGGESTVIGKLLHANGLFEPLQERIESGLPVFGTCAGMILLAKHIDHESSSYFNAIDIIVKRNAFGRQLGSFNASADFLGIGEVPMTFIRAPYIECAAPDVTILAEVDGHAVAAAYKNVLVTAFHPELTDDLRVLEYFLRIKL